VITDMRPPRQPPRIIKQSWSGSLMHLEWDGEGDVFQLESAPALLGSWWPCSDITPDLSNDVAVDMTGRESGFYRVREW